MKLIAPAYYNEFHCIAGDCRHTCCVGWEIDVDEEAKARWRRDATLSALVAPYVEGDPPHFRLDEKEKCPFLKSDGLCDLIDRFGEDVLCQICRDHPRFRNYWSDRTEIGLGLVCEEAARLILSRKEPLTLIPLSGNGQSEPLPEDEAWLTDLRDRLLTEPHGDGPRARLWESLVFRHLADALYDGRVEERIAFIRASFAELTEAWERTDGSMDAMIETVRAWSYDVEYDEEELKKRIAAFSQGN